MRNLVCLLLLFHSFTVFTQNENKEKKSDGSVSGVIMELKTKKTLPYVSIVCRNSKDSILTGGITNEKGKYHIKNIPVGSIHIVIQSIGFKTIKKTILIKGSKKIELQTIYLEQENRTLDEVFIETETSTIVQKIDRRVINIGKDLSTTGTNSLEMLENIPSIQVNFQSGKINLRGNENVQVLVDGKPSNLSVIQLLRQIPSSAVKSVELITNPSAKYTPEGMSGIINIILKKNTAIGFNGGITIGVKKSINTSTTGSLDLNYRNGKVNLYSNYGISNGDFETFAIFDRTDKDLYQSVNFLDRSTTHYVKVGIDYYINSRNTLSFYANQTFLDTNFFVNSQTKENGTVILETPNHSIYDVKEASYNLNYKITLGDEGENIEFEISHAQSANPQLD